MNATVHHLPPTPTTPAPAPTRTVSTSDLCDITGWTYRRVDHAIRAGYINTIGAAGGTGHCRRHPATETDVLDAVTRLLDAGFELKAAFKVARRVVEGGFASVRLPGNLAVTFLDRRATKTMPTADAT